MAIARIPGQDAGNTSATTSVTAAYPGATTSGNLLVAGVFNNQGSTNTVTGWISATSRSWNSGNELVQIFYKIADGTETTVTATRGGASVMQLLIFECSGNSATPLDQTNVRTEGTSSVTTTTMASITTTIADEIIFEFVGTGGAVTSFAVDGGFTVGQNTNRLYSAYKVETSTATEGPTASWTTARNSGSVIASFKGTGNVTDSGTTAFSMSLSKTAEAIKDTGTTSMSAGASKSAESVADHGTTSASLTASGAAAIVDAGTISFEMTASGSGTTSGAQDSGTVSMEVSMSGAEVIEDHGTAPFEMTATGASPNGPDAASGQAGGGSWPRYTPTAPLLHVPLEPIVMSGTMAFEMSMFGEGIIEDTFQIRPEFDLRMVMEDDEETFLMMTAGGP